MTILKFKKEIRADFKLIIRRIYEEKENITYLEKQHNLNELVKFLVIGEDHRFYKHRGYDIIAICRAIRNKCIYNKTEGASTIEQQLVRVLTNQYERTLKRKAKEIVLATKLKKILSKKQIALLYLSLAYYGTGKQGLKRILQSQKLTIDDELNNEVCAGIIARLKYPEPKLFNYERIDLIEIRKMHILKLNDKDGEHYRLSQNFARKRIANRQDNNPTILKRQLF